MRARVMAAAVLGRFPQTAIAVMSSGIARRGASFRQGIGSI
ncbi:hypothetical protein BN131_3327 [Cronobacter malonaticus 681]|nr:hypothetical protein BN131_3327 [Cronobacter malonaticus 681]